MVMGMTKRQEDQAWVEKDRAEKLAATEKAGMKVVPSIPSPQRQDWSPVEAGGCAPPIIVLRD